MWASASLLLAAVASQEGSSVIEEACPAGQPTQLGDAISLVHTSFEIALDVEREWTESQFTLARAEDRSRALAAQAEELEDVSDARPEEGAASRAPAEEPCPNLVGNVYEEPVYEGASPLWEVLLQLPMESNGPSGHLAPCGKFIAYCGSPDEEFRGLIYPRTNISDGHLYLAKFENNSMVGAKPFRATISANGSIVAGKTEFKRHNVSSNSSWKVALSNVLSVRERLLRRAGLANADAVRASAMDQSAICKSEPQYLGLGCEEQGKASITDEQTCFDAISSTMTPDVVDFKYPVEWLGSVEASANLRGCSCWLSCAGVRFEGGVGGLPTGSGGGGFPTGSGGGGFPTGPGGGGLPTGGPTGGLPPFGREAAREAGCPIGKICNIPDSGPMPTKADTSPDMGSSTNSMLNCTHFCAFNTDPHPRAEAGDWQLALCTHCPIDIPDPEDVDAPMEELWDFWPPPTPPPVLPEDPTAPAPTPLGGCTCSAIYDPMCCADGITYDNGCEAGCANVSVVCRGPCPCEDPSATGDPHVNNLAGERFDINQPADYVLLRMPVELSRPALLELQGKIEADEPSDACATYIRKITLSGEWLGNSSVQVLSLRRDRPGSNSAGNASLWPFSISEATASTERRWRSVADFATGSGGVEVLSDYVSVVARARLEDVGTGLESQAFEFMVGHDAKSPASIVVSQGQRQSLSVHVKNMRSLGARRLGGLLGTEPHSREVEEPTQECKDSTASAVRGLDARGIATGFGISASW